MFIAVMKNSGLYEQTLNIFSFKKVKNKLFIQKQYSFIYLMRVYCCNEQRWPV